MNENGIGTKSQACSISICIAAYNEEESITETLKDCLLVLSSIKGNHEILVVNDGSTDQTGLILKELAGKHSELKILTHPQNLGIAFAQRWLIKEAKGDFIFHFPADGEFKAEELKKMLSKIKKDYDIVIGVRQNKNYSFYRKMISSSYNLLVYVLFRKNLKDIGSIRLAKARIWKVIPAQSNSAFFIAEKLLSAYLRGAQIGFCPVNHIWRSKGKSKFDNPIKALKALTELLYFWYSYKKTRLANPYRKDSDSDLNYKS